MDLFFYLTLICFVFLMGTLDCNIDFDFWARLIVGKIFFQTGKLLNNDFYSYGSTHDFIDHEWGSSLIFYLIQNNFGDVGIYIFKSLIIILTLFLIIKIIKLENKTAQLNFLFFFFVLQSICYNIFSTIRCQTFSFFFFAFYIYIIKYAIKNNNYRILWTLPFLNIIWLNLHGGFVVGLAIIFLFALGEFLAKNQNYKYIFYSFFVSLITSVINPYGIKYLKFIFDAFKLNRIHIVEWQSAFFNNDYHFVLIKFKVFFFLVLGFFIYSIVKNIYLKNKINYSKYLILIFCILISLKSMRCHVFFSYAVLAFCYNDFYNIFNKKLPKIIDNIKEIILFILILISTISHLYEFKFLNKVSIAEYPVFCVEFIKQNNLNGNVFTMFHTGSYVAYKLFPNNYVFMDGRYEEVYDNNLINEMGNFFLANNYKGFLKKYHCDILIIDKKYPIHNVLKKDKDWFLAYESFAFSLFLPSKLKNKKFIMPKKSPQYYNETKFQTNIDFN